MQLCNIDFSLHTNQNQMFKNYLLVAFRYLGRQKLFSFINIMGLSVGIAAFYLIFLHVQDEFSYDAFHEDVHLKYRLALERVYPEKTKNYAIVPHSIPEAFQSEIPEIKEIVRLFGGDNEFMIRINDDDFRESNVYLADTNFFSFFTIPILYGDPDKLLSDPNNIVLTRERAMKYFGEEDPTGKTITTEMGEFTVSGVCEDFPGKSHLQFNFVGSVKRAEIMRVPLYTAFDIYAYVKLYPDADPDNVEKMFPAVVDKYAAGEIQAKNNVDYKEYKAAGNGYNYFLQPLRDIHLKSDLELELSDNSNIRYVQLFILIAVMVLLIACINFINLSTARSTDRAVEVGIRKVVGAGKSRLVLQYLTESLVISLLATVFAAVMVEVLLPYYNNYSGKDLSLGLNQLNNFTVLFLAGLFTGLFAGLYPAFVLSKYKPATVLKGKFRYNPSGIFLRKLLVVFQFSISLLLIVFSLFVFSQLKFMLNKDLGYNKDYVLMVPRAMQLEDKRETFRQEVLKLPGVEALAFSNVPVASGFYFGWQCSVEHYGGEVLTTNAMVVDENFLDALDFKLIDGRNFSDDFNDSLSVIINESAIREFGLTNAVGSKLISMGRDSLLRAYQIIGVMNDFHYQSLHLPINSFVFFHPDSHFGEGNIINIKLSGNDMNQTIEKIEEVWHMHTTDVVFDYEFLDTQIEGLYDSEKKSERIFWLFTILAIIIAAVGLFGLSAFTARQKSKEFGVRKVFGAGFSNIIFLLSGEFTRLILFSFLISIPLGFFAIHTWLQDFEYRIDIVENSYIFLIAGLGALLVAYLTILYQAIKAAVSKPAMALRYE